jgi:hypothetical protein
MRVAKIPVRDSLVDQEVYRREQRETALLFQAGGILKVAGEGEKVK